MMLELLEACQCSNFVYFIIIFFYDFGERHSSWILYRFCKCCVKMHLTVVGGCQFLVFYLVLQCLFASSGSWKGQPEA